MLLKNGNKEQLAKNFKLDSITSKKIVSLKNRTKFKKIEDFQNEMGIKDYKILEQVYFSYLGVSITQNSIGGISINENKVVGNQFNGNPNITVNNLPTDSNKYLISLLSEIIL